MNYNYSNFTNPQQYTNYGKYLPLKIYKSNSQNIMAEKKIKNNSDNSNSQSTNNNKIYNNNNNTTITAKRKKKSNNKKVKFNDKVCVINVESYKEYNKIDDNDFLNNLYKANNNNYITNNNNSVQHQGNAKKTNNCECNII